MLVSGNRLAESNVSQILKRIGERVIRGVAGFPEAVSLRKLFWRKGRKAQQVVGTVFDHIDAQIVAGVDAKIRAPRVAQRQAVQLHEPVEGGMFHPLQFGNIHQAPDSVSIENLAVRREHEPQFKTKHIRISAARRLIRRYFFSGCFSVQPRGLKQDGYAAHPDDRLHLLSV